jgi:hypothetical protein
MKERHNVVNLALRQSRERRHAFIRAAITDYRLNLIAMIVAADNGRPDQIRGAFSGCIVSMAESTVRFELLATASDCRQIFFRALSRHGRLCLFGRLPGGRGGFILAERGQAAKRRGYQTHKQGTRAHKYFVIPSDGRAS